MATTSEMMDTKRVAPSGMLILVAAVLGIAGLAAWIYQLTAGLSVTGLEQQVVWGLYIAAFFTAVGAGAALLFLAGLNEFRPLFPVNYRLKVLSLSLACFVAGGLLITMDVGNPLQLWRIISGLRFSSMMTWDFWLLVVAIVVTLIYLLLARKSTSQKALGGMGMLAGVAVVAVEGWMLSSLSARPMWGSGLTLVSFLVGAAIAGLGLGMIAIPDQNKVLRSAMAYALGLSLVLVVAEVLTGLLSGDPRTIEETRLLLSGSAAPIFWFHLLVGLILPLGMIVTENYMSLAAGLAVLGVLVEKLWMLAVGQAQPWLALPQGSYFPSWVEVVAIIGVIAISGLLYYVLLRVIDTQQAQ